MRGPSNDGIAHVIDEESIDIFAGEELSSFFQGGGNVEDVSSLYPWSVLSRLKQTDTSPTMRRKSRTRVRIH